ncbi:UNVERIFIED_ORG: hypothetical protein BCL66_10426 [Martelella mediterranea]
MEVKSVFRLPDRGDTLKKYILACALSLSVPQVLHAADSVTAAPEAYASAANASDWALQITPYLWATGVKGKVSPFGVGPTVPVDRSFSEGRDGLNIAGFVNVWGRYDRFVLSADMMYTDTSDENTYRFPGTTLLPPFEATGKLNTRQFMATVQGGYRVVDTPAFTFDALAGLRLWHISNEITASGLGRSVSYDESFGWVDPVVGARVFFNLTDRLSVQAQADIGGFDANSDLTWSFLSTANYTLSEHLSFSAGYKIVDTDYEKDGHVYDTRLSGPVVGITYRF